MTCCWTSGLLTSSTCCGDNTNLRIWSTSREIPLQAWRDISTMFRSSEHIPPFSATAFGHALLAPVWCAALAISLFLAREVLPLEAPSAGIIAGTAALTIIVSETGNLLIYRAESWRRQTITPASGWVTSGYLLLPPAAGFGVGAALHSAAWGTVAGVCAFLTVSQLLLWIFRPWRQGASKTELDEGIRRAIRDGSRATSSGER